MSGTLGIQTVNTLGRSGYQVLANLADARFKHGGGILDFSNVAPVDGQNSAGTITLTGGPTGGTFTLSYGGQTTSAIAFNATADTVEAALEALTSINNGNIQIGGTAGAWTYEFVEDMRRMATTAITGNGGSLTGGTSPNVAIASTQTGSAGGSQTLPSGRIVRLGDKVIPAGTVVYRTGAGLFAPAGSGTTLTRGDCFVTNTDAVLSDIGSEAAKGLFDGGTVWRVRLQIGGAGQPSEANFLAAFPGINLIRD